jgi:hypothetical protein
MRSRIKSRALLAVSRKAAMSLPTVEPGSEVIFVCARYQVFLPTLYTQPVLSCRQGLDLLDGRNIHDDRAVDANKTVGLEFLCQRTRGTRAANRDRVGVATKRNLPSACTATISAKSKNRILPFALNAIRGARVLMMEPLALLSRFDFLLHAAILTIALLLIEMVLHNWSSRSV